MTSPDESSVPFAAQAIPFDKFLNTGKLPDGYLSSDYVAQQFVERLVHYALSDVSELHHGTIGACAGAA